MKNIALIYSFDSHKTAKIAEKIIKEFAGTGLETIDAEKIDEKTFLSFDNLILGVPTWFDGELPNYWDEFVPALEDMDLKDKKVAIYGLGNQVDYPENFLDAVGIMANLLESRGAKIIGFTSIEGYSFEDSIAKRGDQFCGLGIDYENQHKETERRITEWVARLKKEFE